MSLTTPSAQEISDNIVAQLEASTGQVVPLLPKAFQRVLAKALSGVFVLLYKYAGYMFLQQYVRTAQYADVTVNGTTVNPLREWGVLCGVGDRTPATYAELSVTVTVENQTGVLPTGTQMVGPGNGVTYLTLADVALDAPTVTAAVRAASDQAGGRGAGVVGNLAPGAVLSMANPLANVARGAVVLAQVVTGADAEDVEAYRQRVDDRFKKQPQGGAYADYELWGESVAGITHVYPYAGPPGQVNLYCEATVASSGNVDGIPTGPQLAAVLDAVTLDAGGRASRRPVGTWVNVLPITRTPLVVTVVGITGVDSLPAVQADILAGLTSYFAQIEPYIPGLSVPPRADRVTRTQVAAVAEDIVTAAGGTFADVFITAVGGATTYSLYVLGEGEKVRLNNVVYA